MTSYCESIFQTRRRKTRQVLVGNVGVGGDNPIRIQSMTTSDTKDVDATIEQIIKLADYGCEIARVTVQGKKEATACEGIKNGLIQRGYTIPLVADIHFYPPAAMLVADFVDKVRINPGNFIDKRATFKDVEHTEESYAKVLERIEEKFAPLIEKLKKQGKSLRIGVNHGSLSDRIMTKYGDTPEGMVQSAIEFTEVARRNDYHDIIYSMKSSNPLVMVQAYRLLAARMDALGWDYPLHLGVTEAGEGEDGRIKSAIGIGSLLLDGIGETIRVSLTEDPWLEIDPCKRLIAFAEHYRKFQSPSFEESFRDFNKIEKRTVLLPENLPLHRDGTCGVALASKDLIPSVFTEKLGCKSSREKSLATPDLVLLNEDFANTSTEETIDQFKKIGIGIGTERGGEGRFEIISLQDAAAHFKKAKEEELFSLMAKENKTPRAYLVETTDELDWEGLRYLPSGAIFFAPKEDRLHQGRRFFEFLNKHAIQMPVILYFSYEGSWEDIVIAASTECGSLLADGLGEGILLHGSHSTDKFRQLGFNILQGCRMRTTKTEFISCPSCGRTLFNLQEVSERIRQKTKHLPGVKIAIMGCIVNGPGEMADADFGYVGSAAGKIDLYVGKTCVEKGIDHTNADEKLIDLIKAHDRWVEPEILEAEHHA